MHLPTLLAYRECAKTTFLVKERGDFPAELSGPRPKGQGCVALGTAKKHNILLIIINMTS